MLQRVKQAINKINARDWSKVSVEQLHMQLHLIITPCMELPWLFWRLTRLIKYIIDVSTPKLIAYS